MPNIVKVGCITRLPYDRASELFTTGVPTPFHVFAYWTVDDARLTQIESDVHNRLADYRVKANREFFTLEPDTAKKIISQFLNSYDEVEKQRAIESVRAEAEERRISEEQHKRYIERKAKREWEASKVSCWDQSLKLAEQKYGKSLLAINSSEQTVYGTFAAFINMAIWIFTLGIGPMILGLLSVDLFPESNESKKATLMRSELFAIRDEEFQQFRRNHFQKYSVENPFNDSDPV